MSTLLYGALTPKREQATPGTSTSTAPPTIGTYVDALAGVVPAEVLALHAVIMSSGATATTKDPKTGQSVTTIVDPTTLKWAFAGLIILSIGFYLLTKHNHLDRWDILRASIPPLAFVGWTMLQKTTVFDAVAPGLHSVPRTVIALFAAVILSTAASLLGLQADKKAPPPQ